MLCSTSTKSKSQTGKDVREEREDVVREDIPEDQITSWKAEGEGSVRWVQTVNNSWHSEDFLISMMKWNRIIKKANLHDKIMLFNILRDWEFIILVKIHWGIFNNGVTKCPQSFSLKWHQVGKEKKKSDK